MPGLFARLLSRGADKQLKELRALADRVGTLEPTFHALSDDDLRGQTALFKERYANGESLDDLLPEAFAVMREASDRAGHLPFCPTWRDRDTPRRSSDPSIAVSRARSW